MPAERAMIILIYRILTTVTIFCPAVEHDSTLRIQRVGFFLFLGSSHAGFDGDFFHIVIIMYSGLPGISRIAF